MHDYRRLFTFSWSGCLPGAASVPHSTATAPIGRLAKLIQTPEAIQLDRLAHSRIETTARPRHPVSALPRRSDRARRQSAEDQLEQPFSSEPGQGLLSTQRVSLSSPSRRQRPKWSPACTGRAPGVRPGKQQ